jgi:putative addiction module component (TIGR02574 family)
MATASWPWVGALAWKTMPTRTWACHPETLAETFDHCETDPSWVGIQELGFGGGAIQMNLNVTSVFDVSPSEKLQLVEDLWDDLAATPDAVPVYDWQKEELERRKTNLRNHPASGLTWEEVQRRVRGRHGQRELV